VCGRTIRLKVDGTVFHHAAPPDTIRRWPYRRPDCDGTNRPPKPKDDNDDRP
jgi:hypothetical protein